MKRVTSWQRLLCRLGRHGATYTWSTLVRTHQRCSRCGADLCPLDNGTDSEAEEAQR
jgi:hypothetical protein